MLQIQLFVEGNEIELYKDESVTLTQSIQDIRDIEKVFTDFTRTFNVPASKNNNKFFKHFHNYYIDGFDARKKKDAEIQLNYKPFKKGKLKLEGVQLKNNEPQSYKLTFFGETSKIKDLLGEDKLSGLTELNVFDFDYTDANIEAYMQNGLDNNIGSTQIDDAIIFPLITHTDRLIYKTQTDLEAGTNNVYTGSDTNVRGAKFNQLKPAIRLHALIVAIQNHYDGIEFSSDFFNDTNLPYYNLYMWLHAANGGLFEESDAQYPIVNFTNIRGDVDHISGVRNKFFDNQYNEDKNERKMRVRVQPSGSDEYSLVIKKNGEEFTRFDALTGTTTNGVTSDVKDIEIGNGEYTYYIESGAAQTFTVDITIINDPDSWFSKKRQISFTGTTTIGLNEKFDIVSQIPKMKVIDFITGIFKMFNLTSFVNDDGVIVVQTLDDFYASSTSAWDITKFLDKDESIVDSVVPYRQVNFEYEGNDTFLAKYHENLFNKKWGALHYRAADKFEGETYEIKLPFEHMKFERLIDADENSRSNVMWGWSVDEKQQSTVGKPILFYPVQPISQTAVQTIGGVRKNLSNIYMPSNTRFQGITFGLTEFQSLNFHNEFDEYDNVPNNKTLFASYYENYIKDVFDKRKRITNVSAYLPLKVSQQLSLADQIVIFDRYYRINKISTNFETNKSELELVNILEERLYATSTYSISIDITDEFQITVDNTVITIDLGDITADGFDLPGDPEIPSAIPSNNPVSVSTVPCTVTKAAIETNESTAFCDKIRFSATIIQPGQLCAQDNIDEYGFLIASTESYLTASDDIDTLKADANITVVSVDRDISAGQPSLSVGTKQTTVTGLTDPATRYARFYVKTNINEIHDEANIISDVITESTDCGIYGTADTTTITADDTNTLTADVGDTDGDGTPESTATNPFLILSAGTGSITGYATQPTFDDIDAKRQSTQAAGRCGETLLFGTAYHNGTADAPQIGDSIKLTASGTYAGGAASFPTIDGTNDFGVFAFGRTNDGVPVYGSRYNLEVQKYLVFQWSTAKVVDVIPCPTSAVIAYNGAYIYTHTNMYVFGEYQGEFYGNGYIENFTPYTCSTDYEFNSNSYLGVKVPNYEISHNGSGLNPVPGDYIKIDKKDGIATTSSFGQQITQFPAAIGQRVVMILVDEDLIGRYLIGVDRTTGQVQAFAECT